MCGVNCVLAILYLTSLPSLTTVFSLAILYCSVCGPWSASFVVFLMLYRQFLCGVLLMHVILHPGQSAHGGCPFICLQVVFLVVLVGSSDLVQTSAMHCLLGTSSTLTLYMVVS